MFSERIHRNVYIFSLILLGVSIPFSVFLMSVSQFLLATNWLLELDFKNKWKRLIQNKPALYLIGLFLLHLLWMLNSTNMAYGWHDIKIKLPLFVLAVLIGSSKQVQFKELKLILDFFILSVVASTIVSALIYFGIIEREITDVRQISIFISHIRLSLLINIGLFSSYYFFVQTKSIFLRLGYVVASLWLLYFLVILNAYTGFVVFFFVIIFMLLRSIIVNGKLWMKISSIVAIFTLLILVSFTSKSFIDRFYNIDQKPTVKSIEKYTVNGNRYKHNLKLNQIENGHYVYLYVSAKELETEWNKRSNIDFNEGLNQKGKPIKSTLIYYLTSLNLRKDSLGISKLSEADIRLIEKGYSNYIYKNKLSPYTKVYPILKQMYLYSINAYAEGGSVVQRFEYLKIAKRIISDNFWFGVGTGDVDDAFKQHYMNGESTLSEEFQHRAHNQYVTFFISFGILGFFLSLFFMFAPIFQKQVFFLSLVYILVAFFSMLNEDTLETQAGITFFTFFLLLFFMSNLPLSKSK